MAHTATSVNEEYSDPPRLTEKIITNAEEEAIYDDGKSLFHIPETPIFHLSRANSRMSLNGIGTFNVMDSVLSVTQQGIDNEGLENEDQRISMENIPEDQSSHMYNNLD